MKKHSNHQTDPKLLRLKAERLLEEKAANTEPQPGPDSPNPLQPLQPLNPSLVTLSNVTPSGVEGIVEAPQPFNPSLVTLSNVTLSGVEGIVEAPQPFNCHPEQCHPERSRRGSRRASTPQPLTLSEAETQKLIHELQLHQVELEIQNEEIMLAKEKAEIASLKYTELFDFAPSGYLTLSKKGEITEINNCGLQMLDKEYVRLNRSKFGFFVSDDTKPIFNLFIYNLFNSKITETCEVTLLTKGNQPMFVHLKGVVSENGEQCLLTVDDITERKQLAELNQILLDSLPHPAMYVRRKDRVVIGTNKIASNFGVKPGGHCWREFMKSEHISQKDRKIAANYPDLVPVEFDIKCSFCKGDNCFKSTGGQYNLEVHAFGLIWNTFWIQVSNDVFLHYAVNITERKQAEEALARQNDALQNSLSLTEASFESIHSGMLVVSHQGSIIKTNARFAQMWRIPDDVIATGDDNILLDSILGQLIEPDGFITKVKELYGNYDAISSDLLYFRDGRIFERFSKPLYIAGSPQGRVWSFLDITARKQAEETLLESMDRLSKTQELAHLGSWDLDIHTRQLIWSDEVYRIFGVLPNEFAATLEAFLEFVHPEDRDLVSSAYFSSVQENRDSYEVEHRIIRKHTCEIRYLYEKCEHIRNISGIIVRSVGMVLDITDRMRMEENLRRSEGLLRLVADNLPAYVAYVSAPDLRYLFVNQKYEVSFQLPREQIIGQPVSNILSHSNFEFARQYIDRALNGETCSYENTFNVAEGERWIQVNYVPDKDKTGKVNGIVILNHDVTMRKQAEAEIKLLNTELEHRVKERTIQLENANKELEAFSYSVAHNLRSPLRGIDGWSMALLEDYDHLFDKKGREYLGRVRSEAQRMGDLIDDLLKLSRLTLVPIRKVEVDMTDLVQTIVNQIALSHRDRQFEFIIEPGLVVTADLSMLQIVLTNLLDNALKFTGRKPIPRIEFGKSEIDGRTVFFIRDNGAGFDKAHSKNIFIAFHRMHKQSDFPGSGIGLAIVKGIISRHDGSIWAESKPGEGATFYFTVN